MVFSKSKIIKFLVLITLFTSCNKNEVDGVIIPESLHTQGEQRNKKLKRLVKQTLDKSPKALIGLNDFGCTGEVCHDLGFVITQIIYKTGENEFIKLLEKLSHDDQKDIKGFIMAGLEYGDNNHDGKRDYKIISDEFPNIDKLLNSKKGKE